MLPPHLLLWSTTLQHPQCILKWAMMLKQRIPGKKPATAVDMAVGGTAAVNGTVQQDEPLLAAAVSHFLRIAHPGQRQKLRVDGAPSDGCAESCRSMDIDTHARVIAVGRSSPGRSRLRCGMSANND